MNAWIILLLIVVALLGILFVKYFYVKSNSDIALIRTGAGGQKIVLDGGLFTLPFIHRVEEINLRSHLLEVRRAGERSLMTEDKLRVDVEMEFQVRVTPSKEGVATAAQAFGSKSLRTEELGHKLEGQLLDAMQAVVAQFTMDNMHQQRSQFVKDIRALLQNDFVGQGLSLMTVSLSRFEQTPLQALNENNAFNAVGMRKLAEIVAHNRRQRIEIETNAEIAVKQTELEAVKRHLQLELERQEAEIKQRLSLENARSESEAAIAYSKEASERATQTARIERELNIKTAQINSEQALDSARLRASLAQELQKSEQAIALARKHKEEATAIIEAEIAKSQIRITEEKNKTEEEFLMQKRSTELAKLRAEQEAETALIRARMTSQTEITTASAKAEAMQKETQAQRARWLAEAEGKKAMNEADNICSPSVLEMRVAMHKVEHLPEIVAQMVKPAEKIDSIRIHQVHGLGAGIPSSNTAGSGNQTPVTDLIQGIMSMAVQMPALKQIGESIGLDMRDIHPTAPTPLNSSSTATKTSDSVPPMSDRSS